MSVTSAPSWRAEAATSHPIQPAPTTTRDPPEAIACRSRSLSGRLRRVMTPSRSMPGIGGLRGSAPTHSRSRSHASRSPPSSVTVPWAGSIAVTVVPVSSSIACSS